VPGPPASDTAPGTGEELARTERTELRRFPERGSHRRSDLHAVLDAGFVCHLGIAVDGRPMVIPTSYGRDGDVLYVHGSVASRSLRTASLFGPACVTVTHIDGLVIARSVFEHSVNYRCAMVYGIPAALADPAEKLAGLRAISDQAAPGQWYYARSPTDKELAVTTVLRFDLTEASVKVRSGPPDDGDGPDAPLPVWAGEIPLRTVRLHPVADPALSPGLVVPDHLGSGPVAPGSVAWRELADATETAGPGGTAGEER
jgi:nitroimidazol reductase NimA-like FMN-containing flavoprotein (pyridoxamine 5'-phosphate oxidase superfamily)